MLASKHMKTLLNPAAKLALITGLFLLSACKIGGMNGNNNEDIASLKTQVLSLERDVTSLKQMFQGMTSVVQQQEATLRMLTGKKNAAAPAAAHAAPAKKAHH